MATRGSSSGAGGGPIRLVDAYNAELNARLYGQALADKISIDEIIDPGRILVSSSLAMIRSFAMGTYCKRLPVPVPMLVWGQPTKPSPTDKCADPNNPDEMMWSLPVSAQSVCLDVRTGNVADLLTEAETRGIDGGLQIENPRYEDGKLCATVHAWAKISVFGHDVGFDQRVNVCIPLQGCYPIWSIDIAKIEACFRAPSELCIQLCVGKWGLTKCWDACAHIPIGSVYGAVGQRQDHCSCQPSAATPAP